VGACNHRCTFCAVDYIGYKSNFIDIERYKISLDSMVGKGVKSIMYAGEGEPLLHPKISEIVNYTKENCNIDVSFTTNAFRLDQNFVKKSLHNVSWIKISFNGGNSKTYSNIHQTKESDFHIVSNNIAYAVEHRNKNGLDCAIGLQTLLLPDNIDSVHELCIHARSLGVDYVVIKPYSQHRFSKTRAYENIDYSHYLDMENELLKYNTGDFSVIFRINTINNWLSQNSGRYCKCYATPSVWAYIMADGSVYSCSAYLLDDRFCLGNINEHSFAEIWSSDKRMLHSRFILNELDISECRVNCRMDQVNRYLDSIHNTSVPHINFI
jgi:cyclic pyranopterin phosphate synthase